MKELQRIMMINGMLVILIAMACRIYAAISACWRARSLAWAYY